MITTRIKSKMKRYELYRAKFKVQPRDSILFGNDDPRIVRIELEDSVIVPLTNQSRATGKMNLPSLTQSPKSSFLRGVRNADEDGYGRLCVYQIQGSKNDSGNKDSRIGTKRSDVPSFSGRAKAFSSPRTNRLGCDRSTHRWRVLNRQTSLRDTLLPCPR